MASELLFLQKLESDRNFLVKSKNKSACMEKRDTFSACLSCAGSVNKVCVGSEA